MSAFRFISLAFFSFIIMGCIDMKRVFDRGVWDEKDTVFINNKRYGMVLWLKDNYQFCDKNTKEIKEYLGFWDDIININGNGGVIEYIIKQSESSGMIDPPYDLAYLHMKYDNNNNIIKAYISERKDNNSEYIESIICYKR